MALPPGSTIFPTMVVGSLPRPQWLRDLIEERKAGAISEEEAGRLMDAAIPSAIRMQERAGLDFVSDGEWRRESYVKVFAEAVDGFQADLIGRWHYRVLDPGVPCRRVQARPQAVHGGG